MNFVPASFRGITAMALVVMTACVGAKGEITAVIPPNEALGSVTVAPSAVILAVGDSRQLQVTATSLGGTPITDFDEVMFFFATPSDSTRLRVTSDGVVTALEASNLIRLNVLVKRNGGFKGDQILLQIVDQAIAGATFSLLPPDSANLAAGSMKTLSATLENTTTGASVSNPIVRYSVRAEDAKRVGVYRPEIRVGNITVQIPSSPTPGINQVAAIAPEGTAWVYGEVDAFGTALRDSVMLTLTYPFSGSAIIHPDGADLRVVDVTGSYSQGKNPTVTLAAGATVTFGYLFSAIPMTISFTFDNPAAAGEASPPSSIGGSTGNISPLGARQRSLRRFMTPGTYRWTAKVESGPAPYPGRTATGTIIIK